MLQNIQFINFPSPSCQAQTFVHYALTALTRLSNTTFTEFYHRVMWIVQTRWYRIERKKREEEYVHEWRGLTREWQRKFIIILLLILIIKPHANAIPERPQLTLPEINDLIYLTNPFKQRKSTHTMKNKLNIIKEDKRQSHILHKYCLFQF